MIKTQNESYQEKRMKKWIERINHWKLDKKMQVLVTTSIIVMTLIILAVSTISSVTSMKEKSIELLQTNNDTMAENYVTALEQYKALILCRTIFTAPAKERLLIRNMPIMQ